MSTVRMELTLAAALAPYGVERASFGEATRRRVEQELARMLEALGIAAQGAVEVRWETMDPNDPCRIHVNDTLCPFPEELVAWSLAYVTGQPPSSAVGWELLLRQIAERTLGDHDASEVLSLVCRAAVARRPSALFGPAQQAEYLAALTTTLDRGLLKPLVAGLSTVLDLWISIGDVNAIGDWLDRGLATQRSPEDVAEDVIAASRYTPVEIRLPEDYLEELTLSDHGEHRQFVLVRDGLFYELGVRYPWFRFVIDETLRPRTFALKIKDWTTVPFAGLRADQYLSSVSIVRLESLDVDGISALNPASGIEGSVVEGEARARLDEIPDITTWNALDYLVLVVASVLRQRSRCFIDREGVGFEMEGIDPLFAPVVKAARALYSDEQITRVLRDLIAEDLSVRNLRRILEHLVDFDYIVADPSALIILDDRMPVSKPPSEEWLRDHRTLASFVRTRMKSYISRKYTRGADTMIVYLLDADLERQVIAEGATNDALRFAILRAMREKLRGLPSGVTAPAVLTSLEVRRPLRELIGNELPRVPVLCYQELASDLNIQPIARVGLS